MLKKINNKILLSIIIFLSTIIIAIWWYFWVTKYLDYKAKIAVWEINKVVEKDFSKENCEKILDFDIKDAEWNKNFKLKKYINYKNICNKKYNISNISRNLENCKNIIKYDKDYFEKNYIILDSFSDIQKECSEKYLTAKLKINKFFDVANDFKSSISLDLSLPFYEDKGEVASSEYIENRTNAKKRLIKLISISPEVKLNVNDITLYPKKWIISLDLKPETEYKITLNSFENKSIETKTKQEILTFKTPKNKFLGIILKNPVSLYMDKNPPIFNLIKYNLENKKETSLKICRISNENYSKIEILRWREKNFEEKKEFFINWIDKIKTFECFTKKIDLEWKDLLINKQIDFSKELWKPARSWLYYITFENKEDRYVNNNLQYPIFFGIIDSHITMKISKNWKWFFFVNDFKWKPLANQEIRIYLNKFQDHKKNWDYKTNKETIKYFSPLDKLVLWKEIFLWKTNWQWILEVDLKEKVEWAFDKTFQSWDYDYNGINDSFFVTSASKDYLTYNHSQWNAGIAPWNFGYDFSPDRWWREEPKFYTHIFTDRKLYLPWEEVNLKAIIRNSNNLEIPKNKEFNLIVKDSNNKEIFNKKLKSSEFGSISDKIKLTKNSPLWNYFITLKDDNWEYWYSNFSVEVFKNPTFKTEINLKTIWLNWWEVSVVEDKNNNNKYYKNYSWKFTIKAIIDSKYYNWAKLKNAKFTYKVYKQRYFWENYWNECYWGCYWEPRKKFYTEGKWILDSEWKAIFDINIDFKSNYDDYKYIVEITIKDDLWETISSSNSIVAKLPSHFKRRNYNAWIKFETKNNFYKVWEKFTINGWLSNWKWTDDYNNKYVFIIKKKNYITKYINDIRGYKRPINTIEEKIKKVLLVNNTNFKVDKEGKLKLDFIAKESWEYVFEYWKIDFDYLKNEKLDLEKLLKQNYVSDFINNKEFFTILAYWKNNAKNPIASDNKIRVLSEKVSYHLWEKAKVLIRLPFSKWKILWTVEKQWVIKKELINVNSNIFFKEILVDNTFIPNAFIWVVAIEVDDKKIPEYKLWYTEIVVDKTDKKSFVEIKTNKKIYKPKEKVVLNIKNKLKNWYWKKAELTVMVVDDSLISLMWNVDLNTLEKFYKKLPFQIQTSLTNLAMLKNYYFSRPWIVGWSWFGNFKGWDSAISSRTIFKNTAYYNPSVITDYYWNARVEFELPDNLTNFRIMVIANSSDNFFWYSSSNIQVRKNVIIEDKTPLIYRSGDEIEIAAKIFNNTEKEIWFKVQFESSDIEVEDSSKKVIIKWNSSELIKFWTKWHLDKSRDVKYTISALGDSPDNSDKFEKIIENKEFPSINTIIVKWWLAEKWVKQHFKIKIPENTDIKKSKVRISFSNNLLEWIEKTAKSLLVYPYGCIEQTTSTTYPNAIILNFSYLFPDIIPEKEARKNLEAGIERIKSMQTTSGGFGYWIWDTNPNLHITPYVLRRLVDMKTFGASIPDDIIKKATKYLENNFSNISQNIDKTETFYTFAKLWKAELAYNNLLKNIDDNKFTRHELITYTYWLITWDKIKNKETIDKNIKKIIEKLDNNEKQARYWSKKSDKALFTSMLIDYWYDQKIITKYIKELYSIDWSNYYYSTTAKNNAFIAFAKYMKKYWNNSYSNFAFSIGYIQNRDKRFWLWEEQPNTVKRDFILDDVIQYKENFIELTTYVISWKNIFTNLTLESVPKDKLKIKETSNNMKVSRKIFKISDWKEVTNWVFKKWELYKIKIDISFDKEKERRNLALEDYIPSTFKIINTKFKTEETISWESNINNWDWNHIEYLKDRIFANTNNVWWKNIKFEYTVRPEFRWKFVYPPVNAYMMYDSETNAHSIFQLIKVK